MNTENRIKPWKQTPRTLDEIFKYSRRETKGTEVTHHGVTLRAHGTDHETALALIASHRHVDAEGYPP